VAGLIVEIQGHMNDNASTPGAQELAAAY